tara:strand:+ start:2880 stop:4253 length:1374 start_codon:yes stop_codon:yes gene_type:complete
MFDIIVAISKNRVIGNNGDIPWDYKEDMKYFKKITTQKSKKNIIIMGNNTWKSIGKVLPNRINIVLTRTATSVLESVKENLYFSNDFNELIKKVNNMYKNYNIFVIGGQKIYELAIKHQYCNKIYLTKINKKYEGDTYFPEIFEDFELKSVKKGETKELEFRIYEKTNKKHEEHQYLSCINNILNTDEIYEDRTGVGIKSIFGTQMSYDISEHIPLLTTKKVFVRMIVEELLWFLRGETDNEILQKKNVHIWDGNTSREFLDSLGHTNRKEGDAGPVYGFNFRHYGAKYIDCDTDYKGQGYDQVAEVIRLIKEEPGSRRILINLWNPCVLNEGVLPPCLMMYQFRVYGDKLSCSMYQRSGDMGLGVPFNIASATILTYILAKLTGKTPWRLVHTIGDAHVYKNHINVLEKQIKRNPYPFPILNIKDRGQKCVEDFDVKDFIISGYDSHKIVKMDMAV